MTKPALLDSEPNGDKKLYDLAHLCTLVNNDKSFIKGLIEIFISTIPPLAGEMKEASSQQNWEEVAKIAHKLKPTIETMRIESIREEIKLAEKNAKALNNLNSLSSHIERIYNILLITTEQLKEELKNGF